VRVSRRDLLLLVGGLSLSSLRLGVEVAQAQAAPGADPILRPQSPPSTLIESGTPDAGPRAESLGRSRGGQPLTVFQVGTGRRHVLILGASMARPSRTPSC